MLRDVVQVAVRYTCGSISVVSYRPVCDVWLLARSKVKYHGAYPAGFLGRARALLGVGIDDPVLHVCAGKVRDYPYAGFGVNDKTLDLDPACHPNFVQDARDPFPRLHGGMLDQLGTNAADWVRWGAILIDRPYTVEDAARYVPGPTVLPSARSLLINGLAAVQIGGKVGLLDYVAPRPPKGIGKLIALVGVIVGFENRIRVFSVYERMR